MGNTLGSIDKRKLGGGEGVVMVLSSGYIESSRGDCEDNSKYLEDSELESSDDMCGGNEYGKFEVSSLVESL